MRRRATHVAKKKKQTEPSTGLSWSDFKEWAGSKVISGGKSHQQQGRVSELAMLEDGALIAWVAGSRRYATGFPKNGQDGTGLTKIRSPWPFKPTRRTGRLPSGRIKIIRDDPKILNLQLSISAHGIQTHKNGRLGFGVWPFIVLVKCGKSLELVAI